MIAELRYRWGRWRCSRGHHHLELHHGDSYGGKQILSARNVGICQRCGCIQAYWPTRPMSWTRTPTSPTESRALRKIVEG